MALRRVAKKAMPKKIARKKIPNRKGALVAKAARPQTVRGIRRKLGATRLRRSR